MSHHGAAITDNNIAVSDDMTERSLGQNASAFHDDAVIDLGALFNHNVAEQDGVLYLALDAAAVGDEAVLYVGFIAVVGRSLVLDAGQDRTGALEYLVADILVEHVHVGAVVVEGVLDLDGVLVEQVAGYRAVHQCTGEELALEVDAVMGYAVGQHVDKVLAAAI